MTNKYQLGKIYKVVNTIDDMIYFGSSIQKKLSSRMGEHRSNARDFNKTSKFYTYMRRIEIEHFKIVLIKFFPCESLDELEAEEYRIMNEHDHIKLLNENIVYKKRSVEHSRKVGEASRGEKSGNWKFGSVFRRTTINKEGWSLDDWRFVYKCVLTDTQKCCSFSVKKYGEEIAHNMALAKRKEMYPNSIQDA